MDSIECHAIGQFPQIVSDYLLLLQNLLNVFIDEATKHFDQQQAGTVELCQRIWIDVGDVFVQKWNGFVVELRDLLFNFKFTANVQRFGQNNDECVYRVRTVQNVHRQIAIVIWIIFVHFILNGVECGDKKIKAILQVIIVFWLNFQDRIK